MAKIVMKDTMKKYAIGTFNFSGDELMIEIDGFDEPQRLRDIFAGFDGEEGKITLDMSVDYKSED